MNGLTPISNIECASNIMTEFAERTGLTSARSPKRYLWTDAFAVCNFLGLYEATGEDRFQEFALKLIDQVHNKLGRHRPDDVREGWISGLSETEGCARPLAGGLRIGKSLNERAVGIQPDTQVEWDQDGQYFHYLTKWVHALIQAGTRLNEPHLICWAGELASVAYRKFVYEPAPGLNKRMYWKMRIDLSAPLVTSMGQHDPLDGLVTCRVLQQAAILSGICDLAPQLRGQIEDYRTMCQHMQFETDDPLGLGGMLFDVARLIQTGWTSEPFYCELVHRILVAAGFGLAAYLDQSPLYLPAHHRLAFRELGLAIGLTALESMNGWLDDMANTDVGDVRILITKLSGYTHIGTAIMQTWLESNNQLIKSWTEHQDINAVMLATFLLPDGFQYLALDREQNLSPSHTRTIAT